MSLRSHRLLAFTAMPDPSSPQRPRPRKAPRQLRSQETVKVIVEAAARVLEAGGLDAFSTNAVAERAGVSIGSLYQYFPQKNALVGVLIARETAVLLVDAQSATAAAHGTDAVSALISACVRHQFRRPALALVLDFEEARLPLDAETRDVGERFEAIVAAVLLRPDLPRQADNAAAARDVMAIIKGIVDAAGMNGESDQQALAARVARAIFGYLGCCASQAGRFQPPA